MTDKLIFVSCGQFSDAEKTVGVLLKSAIDRTSGFRAYFAEAVHDLESLAKHVFDGIQQCSGAIVILQDRGAVTQADGTVWGHRSSVWVNQEIAILAYRQTFEARKLPILAFVDAAVKLEGAMTSLVVNPIPLPTDTALTTRVAEWLRTEQFADQSNELFQSKWDQITEPARRVLAILIAEGGNGVKQAIVRQAFSQRYPAEANDADQVVRNASQQFINTGLAKVVKNTHSGDELSIHPTWEFHIRRQLAR